MPDYDNHRLQKFSDNGTFITIIGTSGELEGEFDNPHSVDVDEARFLDAHKMALKVHLQALVKGITK